MKPDQNSDTENKITELNRLNVIKRHLSQSQAVLKNTPPTEFIYTLSEGVLSHDQRVFYENNGFLVIKNLISEKKLDKYRKRFQDICSKKIQVPFMVVMKDVAIAKSEFLDGEKAITKVFFAIVLEFTIIIRDFCYRQFS